MSDAAAHASALLDAGVLAIDASTYGGTVAVLRDGRVVAEREVGMRGEREERLMPAVVATLQDAGVAPDALQAVGGVVCGAGPGSFTSLRIAASIAKGIAQAASLPLYAVPSLALLATSGAEALPNGTYVAALDAIRGEWYLADVAIAEGQVSAYAYLGIVPARDGPTWARERGARLIVAPGMTVDDGSALTVAPHARGVVGLTALLAATPAVDLNAWEPDYGRKAEAQVRWEAAHGRALG